MFFSVSGVARRERAREAEQRLVREREANRLEREADSLERDREADRLERDKEADRLVRKSVARECRGLGVGQCIVTALVSTVCHVLLAWNSGPIPTFTPNNCALCAGLLDSTASPPPPHTHPNSLAPSQLLLSPLPPVHSVGFAMSLAGTSLLISRGKFCSSCFVSGLCGLYG